MRHLNLLILGMTIVALSVLFGFATLKVTGKYRFKIPAEEMLQKVSENTQLIALKRIQNLKDQDTIISVDLRTPAEYQNGHIENAINIPFDKLLSVEFEDFFESNRAKMLYGNTGVGANAAWMVLTQFGYDNLYVLDAGIEQWESMNSDNNSLAPFKGDETSQYDFTEIMKN